MSTDTRTREKRLTDYLEIVTQDLVRRLDWYYNRYHQVNRDSILIGIANFHETRGLKAYFIDHDPVRMRQEFCMENILQQAAYKEGWTYYYLPFPVRVFLHALLSDNAVCIDWIAKVELAHKNDPRSYHFYTHMLQMLLLDEHDRLRDMITIGAKKCGKPLREQFAQGSDYFSLFLRRDKTALEAHIQDLTKIKPADGLEDSFFTHWAVVCTKICWIKGIEVQIDHPLVPMPLMPIEPLAHYEIEYDFLKPGWEPPKQSLMDKFKKWMK